MHEIKSSKERNANTKCKPQTNKKRKGFQLHILLLHVWGTDLSVTAAAATKFYNFEMLSSAQLKNHIKPSLHTNSDFIALGMYQQWTHYLQCWKEWLLHKNKSPLFKIVRTSMLQKKRKTGQDNSSNFVHADNRIGSDVTYRCETLDGTALLALKKEESYSRRRPGNFLACLFCSMWLREWLLWRTECKKKCISLLE